MDEKSKMDGLTLDGFSFIRMSHANSIESQYNVKLNFLV